MVRSFVDLHRLCLLAAFVAIVVTAQKDNANGNVETSRGSKPNDTKSDEIVEGVTAKPGEFPYMASMRVNGVHKCGGAIITSRHVLTAAHCMLPHVRNPNSRVEVVTGTNHIRDGGVVHNVSWLYPHRQYTTEYPTEYDIGIIELANPIVFDANQTSIPIANTWTRVTSTVTAIGWGTSTNGQPSPWLEKLSLWVISDDECNWRLNTRVDRTIMCTHQPYFRSVCMSDSGDPVVFNGRVIGIVTQRSPCDSGNPTLFTKVYDYRQYIKNTLKESYETPLASR